MAVEDTASHETWLHAVHEPDALHVMCVLDQEASGWLGMSYLCYEEGLRLHIQWDIHHRRHNNSLQAMRRCGLHPLRLMGTVTLNFLSGPWGDQANFRKLLDCKTAFFATESYHNALFQEFYPRLSRAMHTGNHVALGSIADMEAVFRWVAESELWRRRGPVVKGSRWHNFSARAKWLRREGVIMLFMLMVLQVQDGTLHSFADLAAAQVLEASAAEQVNDTGGAYSKGLQGPASIGCFGGPLAGLRGTENGCTNSCSCQIRWFGAGAMFLQTAGHCHRSLPCSPVTLQVMLSTRQPRPQLLHHRNQR